MSTLTLEPPSTGHDDGFSLDAIDVTGTVRLRSRDVHPGTPASVAAEAIAARMQLPSNVPWALRSDRTGAFLDDDGPIGEQLDPGEQVVVTPKAHLGSGR
jgi:hypothetical protein